MMESEPIPAALAVPVAVAVPRAAIVARYGSPSANPPRIVRPEVWLLRKITWPMPFAETSPNSEALDFQSLSSEADDKDRWDDDEDDTSEAKDGFDARNPLKEETLVLDKRRVAAESDACMVKAVD